ncbi:MAG: hypothetical protein C4327_06895 [Meiothermus sp.]
MEKPYRASQSGFYVAGLEARTSPPLEADPQTAKIPQLWQRFRTQGLESRLPRRLAQGHPFCVYFDYEEGPAGAYSVVLGYQVPGLEDVPPGLTGLNIPGGRYLVFTTHSDNVAQTWAEIQNYFAQPGSPVRAYTYDYEEHLPPAEAYFRRAERGEASFRRDVSFAEPRARGAERGEASFRRAERGEEGAKRQGADEVRIYVAVR